MARIIVMPDATDLRHGIRGTILYAAWLSPEHLDNLQFSEELLGRLAGAVRGEAAREERLKWA